MKDRYLEEEELLPSQIQHFLKHVNLIIIFFLLLINLLHYNNIIFIYEF